jgi:putative transposase
MDVVIPAARKEAELAVLDYIETFYDSKRRHSSLGQISPVVFEQKYEKLRIKTA